MKGSREKFPIDRRGAVAIGFALASLVLIFLFGMGIDYGMAVDRRTQLDAYADAAALAALTPTQIASGQTAAIATARSVFDAQAKLLSGVTYDPSSLSVNISTVGNVRTATVAYTAKSLNAFPIVFGPGAITVSGNSAATATIAPDIDFYLLLDRSPSMAIAATQTGISEMVAHTPAQGGCAFGCHQSNPGADHLDNPYGEDNYALARSLGVTLRIDMLRAAVQNLITTAGSTEQKNNAAYRIAQYTFDYKLNDIGSLTANLSQAQLEAQYIQLLEVYSNNWLTENDNNDDEDTNYDAALTGVNNAMPDPGMGTKAAGDRPQEVLFFVTDGVEDEDVNGFRKQSTLNPALCSAIKNRGIRIAVLYTEYLPLPTNSWYNFYISPFQQNIAPTLQECASPGLYFEVKAGGDISNAMVTLFQSTVESAYLSK